MAAPRTTRTRKTAAAKPAAAKRTAAKPAAAKANGKNNGRTAAPKQTDTAAPAELTGLEAMAANAQRAAKAKRTRDESAATDETRSCAVCAKEKPINKFPTTSRNKDGQMGRANTCRQCRDAARATTKAR